MWLFSLCDVTAEETLGVANPRIGGARGSEAGFDGLISEEEESILYIIMACIIYSEDYLERVQNNRNNYIKIYNL